MSLESLADAIERQPEPPCAGCEQYQACALKTLACKDFFRYVTEENPDCSLPMGQTSIDRNPTREMYDVVFGDDSFAHTRLSRGGPLKPEVVESIRVSSGSLRAVAHEHGVDKSTVLRIRKGKIYKKPLIESSLTV